jgi:NSS family neurotransmitter:Na+ symporter
MMVEHLRERWGSGAGFMLATLGSSVGLGNVWRFSYVAGDNGGGAFLLVYLVIVLVVGVPLLLGEFALGRSTQRESAGAFEALAPSSRWRHLGLLGVVVAGLILAYYGVVAGWVLKYLSLNFLGTAQDFAAAGYATAFRDFIAHPVEPIAWQFAVMLLTTAIVAAGVERGIEALSMWLMPALGLLMLMLALHSATMPGFQRGVAFLLQPDWTALARPEVYLAALGQAFFSIGLAMGVMVTYGSYVPPHRRLPGAAATIALGDTFFAVLGGLVIFPAVFSFGLDPAQGPALAFVVLPEVFAEMAGGALVGTAFFALLVIAALTSAVSLLEVPVAFAMQRFGWSRRLASAVQGGLIFMLGIPASLGYGPWAGFEILGGRGILDAVDFIAADILLPLNGLLMAVFLGWVWQRRAALEACDLHSGRLGRLWRFSVRWVVPILVALVLAHSVWGA